MKTVSILFLFCSICLAEDTTKPNKEEKEREEQAKRLGIEKPVKSMKFDTVKSDKYKGEEYDIVIDEEAVKETDYSKEDVRRALKEAMESRTDRRENNNITIEIEEIEGEKAKHENENKEAGDTKEENQDKQKPKGRLVAKIKKKISPANPHTDSKEPAEKKFKMFNGKFFKITTSGACKSQNEGTLEAVKFPNPA